MTTRILHDNPIEALQDSIGKLSKRLHSYENVQILNLPIYDFSISLPIGAEGDIAIGVDGLLYRYFNGSWDVAASNGGLDPWTAKVIKAVDQSFTSTSYVDVSSFSFITTNGYKYEIDFCLVVDSASATPDMRFAWGERNITSSFADVVDGSVTGTGTSTADVGNNFSQFSNLQPDSHGLNTALGIGTAKRMYRFFGTHQGRGGTVKMQIRQNVGNANAIVLRAGSFIRYREFSV